MKTDKTSPLSIVDALTEGLGAALARPWLIAIPAAIDLALWLAPRLTINNLVQRFLVIWEAFFRLGLGANQPAAGDMVPAVREGMTQLGQGINLAEAITGSWLSMPSAVAAIQSPRLTLISDVVMAPIGLGVKLKSVAPSPWQGPAIEINSFWVALLIVVGLWLCGQVIAAFFLRAAARKPVAARPESQEAAVDPPIPHWRGVGGLLSLSARLAVFSVLLMVVVFTLYLPLGLAMLVVTSSGSGAAGMMFAVVGGMTLWALMWLLTSLFFVSEAMVLDGQPFWASLWEQFSLDPPACAAGIRSGGPDQLDPVGFPRRVGPAGTDAHRRDRGDLGQRLSGDCDAVGSVCFLRGASAPRGRQGEEADE